MANAGKTVVLLSAGLDSTVSFLAVKSQYGVALAITCDYGQRAAAAEIAYSRKICERYNVPHQTLKLDWLAAITNTALVNRENEVPTLDIGELDSILGRTLQTANAVWVPNRNGVFINIAAAFAESLGADIIVTGFNAEEAATFPDNSPQYVEAINEALNFSTQNQVRVFSPTQNMNKTEIVNLGIKLDLPWDLIWSCYKEADSAGRMCGECESCLRMVRATKAAGVWDKVKERFAHHAN